MFCPLSCMQRKRKQYALLFHVLEELQRAPAEESVTDAGIDHGGASAMEVDT